MKTFVKKGNFLTIIRKLSKYSDSVRHFMRLCDNNPLKIMSHNATNQYGNTPDCIINRERISYRTLSGKIEIHYFRKTREFHFRIPDRARTLPPLLEADGFVEVDREDEEYAFMSEFREKKYDSLSYYYFYSETFGRSVESLQKKAKKLLTETKDAVTRLFLRKCLKKMEGE